MSMFDNLKIDDEIQEEKDSLGGGFGPVDSAVYDLEIKHAYTSISAGGAMAMNLLFTTKDGKEIRAQEWMTSGTAKGCKNFYMIKKDGKETGKKAYLPGFNAINSLCLLTVGKNISDCDATVKKTIKLYNFDAGEQIPTEVDMVMELVGQTVTAGVIREIVDKKAKNDATGKYEPTGETREINTVDKYFRQRDGLTVVEIKAKAESAEFKQQWADKWTGQIKDSSTAKTTGGTTGAPVASGASAPKENLFA